MSAKRKAWQDHQSVLKTHSKNLSVHKHAAQPFPRSQIIQTIMMHWSWVICQRVAGEQWNEYLLPYPYTVRANTLRHFLWAGLFTCYLILTQPSKEGNVNPILQVSLVMKLTQSGIVNDTNKWWRWDSIANVFNYCCTNFTSIAWYLQGWISFRF